MTKSAAPPLGLEVNVSNTLEKRRKRLIYRCWHRGTKELDLLIGSFADRHLAELDEAQLGLLESLLELPEPLLYDWLTGGSRLPAAHDHDVSRLLLNFKLKPPAA